MWRDSGLTPKIGPIDAYAVFPLALFFFNWSYWTASVAFTSIVLLYLVQRTGMSPVACLRAIRIRVLVGKRRDTRMAERQWRKRCRW